MGKKKNAAKKSKHSDSQGAGNNKSPERPQKTPNQTELHSKVSKSSHTSQSSPSSLKKSSSQHKSSQQKSSLCWCLVILLAASVAVPAVVYREDIGEALDHVLQDLIQPQVLILKERFLSGQGEDQGSSKNIPSDAEEKFEDLNVEPVDDELDEVDSFVSQPEEVHQHPEEDEKRRKETVAENVDIKKTKEQKEKQLDEAGKVLSNQNKADAVSSNQNTADKDSSNQKRADTVSSQQNKARTEPSSQDQNQERVRRNGNSGKPVDSIDGIKAESVDPSLEPKTRPPVDKTETLEAVKEKNQEKISNTKTEMKPEEKGKKEEGKMKPNTDKKKQENNMEGRKEEEKNKKSPGGEDRKEEEVKVVQEKPGGEASSVKKKSESEESEVKVKSDDGKKAKENKDKFGKESQEGKGKMPKVTEGQDDPKPDKKGQEGTGGNERQVSGKGKSGEEKEKVKPEKKDVKGKEDSQPDSDKREKEDMSTYVHSSITNKDDFQIRHLLDEADQLYEKDNIDKAVEKYDVILRKHQLSPRAHYGKGLTLDKLGFKYMSNEYLEQAIDFLARVLQLPNVPDALSKLCGRKLADRQQFRGWGAAAVKTFKFLNQKFPEDLRLKNDFGVSYMMIGQDDRAKDVFKQVLAKDPNNGFAKAHLGFIYKIQDSDLDLAVKYLMEGIRSGEPGTVDGRFYLHLGDSLLRLGREKEARDIFQEGEDKKLFLSAWQRSLYNVENLTARPWWTPKQTGYEKYLKLLEDNWKTIRDEGLAQLNSKTGSFVAEEEKLRDTGDWKQFTLYQQGQKKKDNCAKAPKTCALIDQIPDASGCKRGQVKFSVMSPGIHVWPHVGPTNCRIRAHLGLVVPEGPIIRVVNETRTWTEGRFIIFDDSFEHEVWHEGSELRLVLIVDFWHPDLNSAQKRRLSAI